MQNRYVGDIGDYVKLAIMRDFTRGCARRLGIAWWLFPDENHNGDGGHREYLQRPEKWKPFDPDLFECLLGINEQKNRDITLLQNANLFPNAVFAGDPVPCGVQPFAQRPAARQQWLANIKTRFKDCDLVFLDPDNGVAPDRLRPTCRRAGKSVLIGDLAQLQARHQTLVIYHHQTRRKGGHLTELNYVAQRLRISGFRVSGVLRAKPYSPRAFFILSENDEFHSSARRIEATWKGQISWHPYI